MTTPKFVAVLFDGNGKVISTHPNEREKHAQNAVMREFIESQKAWEAAAPAARPADPPMWDLYAKI